MVTEERPAVKLIDLGAVSRINSFGYLYGTPGYRAPEIVRTTDGGNRHLYRWPDAGGAHVAPSHPQRPIRRRTARGRPGVGEVQLIRPAVAPGRSIPTRSDASAARDEMSAQLLGVLREVVAGDTGVPRPGLSTVFTRTRSTFGVDLLVAHTDVYLDGLVHAERLTAPEIVTALPVPLVDPTDVAATVLSATVLSQPVQTLDSLRAARHDSLESEGWTSPNRWSCR